jgi:hypothetical protein
MGYYHVVMEYARIFFRRRGFSRRGPARPAATKFSTTDGHGLTRIKPSRWAYSKLRVLRALRGEKVSPEMSDFGILHCGGRGEDQKIL